MQRHDCHAALVRPDHYTFGAAATPGELDALVYNRTLRAGAGNRMYGLEVCKSLHLPAGFLDEAYAIRHKYFPESRGELSHPVSLGYNAAKIRGLCELCNVEMSSETHHVIPQCQADEKGFVRGENGSVFHKNHIANLLAVCEKCHLLQHKK